MFPTVSLEEGIFATGNSSAVIRGTQSEQMSPAIAIRSPLALEDSVRDVLCELSEFDLRANRSLAILDCRT